MKAAIKACETVDKCCSDISAVRNNYSVVVISDHGNCDVMKNDDGLQILLTKNLVPTYN